MRTLFCAALLAAAAAAQSLDELLPDSTLFYLSIENAARTKERFQESRLSALWKDEAVQAFVAKPRAKWAAWMEKLRKEDGLAPDDVLGLLAGQAVLGASWVEGPEEPAPLIVADVGENAARLRELVASLEKQLLEEQGYKRDEDEFRGVAIVTYAKEEDKTSWLLDGKVFAMADGPDPLKDLLARRERREEGTLASRELYRRVRGRLGARGGDLLLYVDAPNIWKLVEQGGDAPDEEAIAILDALGINALEAFALEISVEPKALAMRAFLAVKGPKVGLLKLLDGKNSALLPPRYAPADALSAFAFTIDVPEIWAEGRRVADKIEEGATAQLDARLEMLKAQVGVDIQQDLIGALGTELTYHERPSDKPMAMFPFPIPRFTVGIQLKDRERFEGAIDKLLASFAPGMEAQDYLGVKLRKVPTPFGMAAMAVLPDRFLFAMEEDDLKDVIARYGKETRGFLDREDAVKALGGLPPNRMLVSAEDTAKKLKQGSLALQMMIRSLEDDGAEELKDLLDPSLFPAEEVLVKYFGVSTGCAINEEDGVTFLSTLELK